jgi:hypothetical protein
VEKNALLALAEVLDFVDQDKGIRREYQAVGVCGRVVQHAIVVHAVVVLGKQKQKAIGQSGSVVRLDAIAAHIIHPVACVLELLLKVEVLAHRVEGLEVVLHNGWLQAAGR